jgi:hypothetical protein
VDNGITSDFANLALSIAVLNGIQQHSLDAQLHFITRSMTVKPRKNILLEDKQF